MAQQAGGAGEDDSSLSCAQMVMQIAPAAAKIAGADQEWEEMPRGIKLLWSRLGWCAGPVVAPPAPVCRADIYARVLE